MKINYIPQLKSNTTTKTSYHSPLFCGGKTVVPLKKPIIKDEVSNVIYEKVIKVFNALPDNAKLTKPILFKVGNENYGLLWDKMEPNKKKLTLKNMVNTVEDWNLPNSERAVFSAIFSKDGLMQSGELTEKKTNNYNTAVFFHRTANNRRLLDFGSDMYKPAIKSRDYAWVPITNMSYLRSTTEIYLDEKLKDTTFSKIFIELINANTSILAK